MSSCNPYRSPAALSERKPPITRRATSGPFTPIAVPFGQSDPSVLESFIALLRVTIVTMGAVMFVFILGYWLLYLVPVLVSWALLRGR